MQVSLISVDRDVEGWIAPYVLTKAGYEIVEICWLDVPNGYQRNDNDLQTLWLETKRSHPVILCTHSFPSVGVVVCNKRGKKPYCWPHEKFQQPSPVGNEMLRLFTCFCDFDTGQPTDYINLPGFDHEGQPGYFAVIEYYKSCQYRKWLGILKQRVLEKPEADVATLFAQVITPRLQKYEKISKQPWLFYRIDVTDK